MKYTLEQQLEAVQEAIMAILTGAQDYKIGSRSVTRADLADLQKYEAALKSQIADENGTSINYARTVRA